jgi:hypothetical protein
MGYCTITDLQKHLTGWSKLIPSSVTEADFAAEMIRAADSYINSRLCAKYASSIPFSPVPGAIKTISINLSIYHVLCCNYAGQAIEKIDAIKLFYYDPQVKCLMD